MEARHNNNTPNNDLEQAKILYSKTIELEKQLRNELKKKSPLDRSIALLRNNIRDNFEQILFLNYEFAVSKEVEQAIWKSVFYRVIEEFRKRLRKSGPSSNGHQSPQQQRQDEEQKKLGTSFKQFLTSAMNFYQRLLCKFQATFHLTLDGSVAYRLSDDTVKLHRSYLSCHRCYIFLGDLARYHRDIKMEEDKSSPPVWTRAAQYYQRALLILPDNGNPHNQLAVYEDDSFSGVYRYFRSLAIRQPFVTARDNLKVLFEKNKLKLDGDKPTTTVDQFLAKFVHLQGIFFNKTEMESFNALKPELLHLFADLLAKPTTPYPALTPETTLKMISMLIFTVHNAILSREGVVIMQQSPSRESEDAAHLQALAVATAFEFVTVLVRSLSYIPSSDVPPFVEWLGCAEIFLEWVRVHPEYLSRCSAAAQSGLWDAIALLLNATRTPKSSTVPTLEAEAELRGFSPVHNYIRMLPQPALVCDPDKEKKQLDATEAGHLLQFRMRRWREFASFACSLQPQGMFHNKDTGWYSTLSYKPNSLSSHKTTSNHTSVPVPTPVAPPADDNRSVEDDSLEDDDNEEVAFTAGKFEFVEEDDEDEERMNQEDELDDEVILFRPEQNFNGANAVTNTTLSPPSTPPSPSNGRATPNGNAVHTKGAEFGIIGSRAKTPPYPLNITNTVDFDYNKI